MLHASAAGEGDAITFLHGFGLDGRAWAPQVASFRSSHRAVTVDLPGFGRSPRRTDSTTPDAIAGALDGLGIERTHVVGLSLGGAVATDFALAHPARVRSLTVADALLLGYPVTLDTWDRCAELARAGDCAGAAAHWLTDAVFDGARTRPAVWAAIREMIAAYDCGHWTGTSAIRWASTKPRPRLGEIRVPALVIVGEHDTPAFQAMADAYAAEIPGARRVTLRACGHVSNMEEPAAFDAALRGLVTASA
jgi:3-oxoadipate enol-lactonase